MALGSSHDIVLLDELTNNLDPSPEALLIDILTRQHGRRAVLLVSHEHHFLETGCSRVLEVAAWWGRFMEGAFEPLLDPLFRLPFVTGLLLSATLPLLGAYLMLRDEWLTALGLAHLAAAGALLGLAAGLPAVIAGTAGAVAGGATKTLLEYMAIPLTAS